MTSSFEGKISHADQFSVDLIGSADMYGDLVSMYNVNFTSNDGETIKLASNIEGELAANSLVEGIVEQLFTINIEAETA